jgi:predicted ATPase/DNA-binding SARP family transcriptional activator
MWRIDLLGGLRVQEGARILTRFPKQKAGALLAYLAYTEGHPRSRDALVEILWPEAAPDAGRNHLRNILHVLRHALEPDGGLVIADRDTIALDPAAFTTDVAEWRRALQAARGAASPADRIAGLARAVALYQGPLLPDAEEDWMLTEREHLAAEHLAALHQLVLALEQSGDPERALEYARLAVHADPLREEAHFDLMRLCAALGQPSAALRQFGALERLLRAELGEIPSARTRALAEEIRLGSLRSQRLALGSANERQRGRVLARSAGGDRLASGAAAPRLDSSRSDTTSHAPRAKRQALPLPPQFTRFFGREEEVARLAEALSVPETRLVTLTGPGGSGKTRLAIAVAGRLQETFNGAIAFVALADLAHARRIPDAVAGALGLPSLPDSEPLEQVIAALRSQPWLLVLDNFEHLVVEGALMVRTLLEGAPGLTCLVTSRQRLNLAGEQEVTVLPLPTPRASEPPERLLQCPSVRLFVDRARAVRPEFRVTAANAAAMAMLCDRLEGLPLALELAAARAQVLTPAQILAHLERRFDFLVGGQRDVPARHRSLQAALAGSYQLLTPELQRFFARLSVFRGGFDLAAAEQVCGEPGALEHLTQLRESSLVVAEERGEELRFRLLETLREFGAARLATEERSALARRHAAYYRALAEEAEPWFVGREEQQWRRRLEWEHDNLRAALTWSLADGGATETGLRLAASLRAFWENHPVEGQEYLGRALASIGDAPARVRARVLHAAGALAVAQGDLSHGNAWLEESLAIMRSLGDRAGVAAVLGDLGLRAYTVEDPASARTYLEECVAIRRDTGDRIGVAWALQLLARVTSHEGQPSRSLFEESLAISRECGARSVTGWSLHGLGWATPGAAAVPFFEESLAIFQELADRWGAACALESLAKTSWHQGDYARARALYEEFLGLCREWGREQQIVHTLGSLGHMTRDQGDYGLAAVYYRQGLLLRRERGNAFEMTQSLEDCAGLAGLQGKFARAARLLGAGDAACESLGMTPPVALPDWYRRTVQRARAALGEEAFAAAWAEGRAMTLPQAVDRALADLSPI